MPFRFPLAAFLKLRSLLEEQEQIAMERAVSAERVQQRRLEIADELTSQHRNDIQQSLASGMQASELHWSESRLQSIRRARAHEERVFETLSSARAEQAKRYIAANRDLETVEHLKSTLLGAYTRQLQQREQQLIDSLHLAAIVRKRLKSQSSSENISHRSD